MTWPVSRRRCTVCLSKYRDRRHRRREEAGQVLSSSSRLVNASVSVSPPPTHRSVVRTSRRHGLQLPLHDVLVIANTMYLVVNAYCLHYSNAGCRALPFVRTTVLMGCDLSCLPITVCSCKHVSVNSNPQVARRLSHNVDPLPLAQSGSQCEIFA